MIQSYPGLERVITWQPAANLFPNGQRTQAQTIIINEPGSLFCERWNQVDINFRKNFRYGNNKVHTFQLDIFNVFNNNSIRTTTDTVGTSLGQVTAIMPGRFPRVGVPVQMVRRAALALLIIGASVSVAAAQRPAPARSSSECSRWAAPSSSAATTRRKSNFNVYSFGGELTYYLTERGGGRG